MEIIDIHPHVISHDLAKYPQHHLFDHVADYVTQRPITAEEFSLVMPFLKQRSSDLCHGLNPDPLRQTMADLTQQLFCANEFLYVD